MPHSDTEQKFHPHTNLQAMDFLFSTCLTLPLTVTSHIEWLIHSLNTKLCFHTVLTSVVSVFLCVHKLFQDQCLLLPS